MIADAADAAKRHLDDDLLDYAAELADEAATTFERRIAGWEAGLRWRASNGGASNESAELESFRRAAVALVAGIRAPLRRLESICFYEPIGYAR
jgi:hypothetical protein